jgi:hypothetical protein
VSDDGSVVAGVLVLVLFVGFVIGLAVSGAMWKQEAIAEGHARYGEQTGTFEWRETGCLGPVCLRQPQPKAEKEDTQ